MTDEHPHDTTDGQPMELPPTNPATKPGEPGVSADGTPIPAERMVDDPRGADPEALARFQSGAVDSTTLLEMLRGAGQQRPPYRPAVMTRGDILPREYEKLNVLYKSLKTRTGKKQRLSALGHGLLCLLSGLIERGDVNTDRCREYTCAAYGFDADTIMAFDTALGIVWSVAMNRTYDIVPGMRTRVRELIKELGLDESDLA